MYTSDEYCTIYLFFLIHHSFCTSSYHQKVPAEAPELESTEIGIATPVEFPIPSVSPRWKPEILSAFDTAKSKAHVSC